MYEALGIEEFKIIDRSRSTAWLLRATKAYASRRYDGNLLDIISLEMLGDPNGFHPSIDEQSSKGFFKLDAEDQRLTLRMFRLRQRLLALNVTIDNTLLSGFLEGFRKIRCMETFCDDCLYCNSYAERAVRFDPDEAAALVADIDELVDDFMTARW